MTRPTRTSVLLHCLCACCAILSSTLLQQVTAFTSSFISQPIRSTRKSKPKRQTSPSITLKRPSVAQYHSIQPGDDAVDEDRLRRTSQDEMTPPSRRCSRASWTPRSSAPIRVPVSYLFSSSSSRPKQQQQQQHPCHDVNVRQALDTSRRRRQQHQGLGKILGFKSPATTILSAMLACTAPQPAWAAKVTAATAAEFAATAVGTTITTTAVATATTKSALHLMFPASLSWKRVVHGLIALWSVAYVTSVVRVRRRQSKDATSEWGRYARHPGARGRAIVWLLMEQAVLLLASELLRFKRGYFRTLAGLRFTTGLLQLGPLYIKLGQIVSCRKNLLGPEWISAMERLQDQVPAKTGDDAMQLAYSTMVLDGEIENAIHGTGIVFRDIDPTTNLEQRKVKFDSIFRDFDSTPLAAASLGQVHRATLRSNGDIVAVKVQRPLLRQIYDQDFKLLLTIAKVMDRLPNANKNVGGVASSWTKIFQDAEAILYREIDYRDEASNGIRFCNDFGLTKGGKPTMSTARARNQEPLPSAADWLRTPYVYEDICTERLLVMEYVPSIKITNTAKLQAAGVTELDKIELADSLARAYLRQFCCNLFFSTDPHAGNLGVEMVPIASSTSSSSTSITTTKFKPRLVMYDFGQAASLTQDQADGILEIIDAIIDTNVDRSIQAFLKMGVLTENADLDKVRQKVGENYRTGKIKANQKTLQRQGYKSSSSSSNKEQQPVLLPILNGTAVNDTILTSQARTTTTTTTQVKNTSVSELEVMSFFTLPAEYAFVARAISQMDGVGKGLDPEFDFISSAAPYIVEIKGTTKYLQDEFNKFLNKFQQQFLGGR